MADFVVNVLKLDYLRCWETEEQICHT